MNSMIARICHCSQPVLICHPPSFDIEQPSATSTYTSQATKMSKKGLPLDEKKIRMVELFHETVRRQGSDLMPSQSDIYSLKELEKAAPKVKGISELPLSNEITELTLSSADGQRGSGRRRERSQSQDRQDVRVFE